MVPHESVDAVEVSEEEFRDGFGMGLDDLKRAVYDKLGSGEEAMKAMDKDGDGVCLAASALGCIHT